MTLQSPLPPGPPATALAEWRAHWVLVLTATIGIALASAMSFTLGVMMLPIEKEFGWTRAEISSGPALISITGVLLGTAAGYAIDRLGARITGILTAISMSGILMLMATMTDSLWQWWGLWLLFGLAATFTSTVWLTPISSIFAKSRGLAIAMTVSGSGFSAAFIPLVTQHFVAQGHWRMGYLVLGAAFAVILIPLALARWRGAEEVGLASGTGKTATEPAVLPGLTARQGFTSPNFYKLFAGWMLSTVAIVAVLLNLVPILVSTGISASQAAGIAGAAGLAGIFGRFFGGVMMDLFDAKLLVVASAAASAVLPAALLFAPGSVSVALVAVIFNAFVSGIKQPGLIYLISRYFGPRSFGTLFGTIGAATSIASGVGPMLGSYVYDVTRSYTPVLWAALPCMLVAALLYLTLGRYPDFAAKNA